MAKKNQKTPSKSTARKVAPTKIAKTAARTRPQPVRAASKPKVTHKKVKASKPKQKVVKKSKKNTKASKARTQAQTPIPARTPKRQRPTPIPADPAATTVAPPAVAA